MAVAADNVDNGGSGLAHPMTRSLGVSHLLRNMPIPVLQPQACSELTFWFQHGTSEIVLEEHVTDLLFYRACQTHSQGSTVASMRR